MSKNPEVNALVACLVGSWEGSGIVSYPTLDDFAYREELEIAARPDHPALHYEQRTWTLSEDGESPSHWETGFLRINGDWTVRILNAQGGRAEVMEGTFRTQNTGWLIELHGVGYAGDPRMRASTRSLRVGASTIDYTMSMSTNRVDDLTIHLKGLLSRVDL
ncbi:MAG: heme-binding beta-barrel domain-containing protein [Actinobacteria bacterium]|nr:heme-binding beta-barrel domain-containing protein [Actinomycetota bacterium]